MAPSNRALESMLSPLRSAVHEYRCRARYRRLVQTEIGTLLEGMKETQSIFVHIPKNGGKSIITSVYGADIHEGAGHADYKFYKGVFGKRNFARFFKFAFVRNPWDRLYSGYTFVKQGGFGLPADREAQAIIGKRTFESFVHDLLPGDALDRLIIFRPQTLFVCDDAGRCVLDRACRFEHFSQEFELICHRLGIEADMPHVNPSKRPLSYQAAYTDAMIAIVAEKYADDIDTFGYRFDEVAPFEPV